MRRLSWFTPTVLGIASLCNGQTVSDPQFEGSLAVPQYQGGYVFDWDAPKYTKFTVYSPDAKPVYSLPFNGANNIGYAIWAVDGDGAAARAYEDAKYQGKIDLLDGLGKLIRTIDTGSYIPTHVAFAPDHSLWTLGYRGRYESSGEDFRVVRHYARSGENLGEALPWSEIAGDYNAYTALQPVLGGRMLFCGNDRIGFISRANEGRAKWIEVSFSGSLLGQYGLGSYTDGSFAPRALTSSEDVYAVIYQQHRAKGYAVLDRANDRWRKVKGYPKGALIGSDGDRLVFSELDGGWTVLHQVASTALSVEKPQRQLSPALAYDPLPLR